MTILDLIFSENFSAAAADYMTQPDQGSVGKKGWRVVGGAKGLVVGGALEKGWRRVVH